MWQSDQTGQEIYETRIRGTGNSWFSWYSRLTLKYEVSSWAMCSQDQESRHHGQQARGEEGGVVGRPERGLGDGDPGEQKIFRAIRKYLLAMYLVLSSSTPCLCSPWALLAWHSYLPRSASVTPRIWDSRKHEVTCTTSDVPLLFIRPPPITCEGIGCWWLLALVAMRRRIIGNRPESGFVANWRRIF